MIYNTQSQWSIVKKHQFRSLGTPKIAENESHLEESKTGVSVVNANMQHSINWHLTALNASMQHSMHDTYKKPFT